MTGRMLRLPALVACAVALLAVPYEAEAAFPGQNGTIAFYKSVGAGNDDIFAVNADGSGLRNVTNSRVGETSPAWSPDGKRLVYQRSAPNWDREIGIVHFKSGSKRSITDNSYNDLDPSFSPDGDEIAFVNQSDPVTHNDIYAMKRDGSGRRQLTESAAGDLNPVFSPDGAEVAFERNDGSGRDKIWTMDADGGNEKILSAATAGGRFKDSDPDWSPDGVEVVFDRYDVFDGTSDIYAVRPDGTGLRNVTGNPNVSEGSPSFSPDGRRIAFLRYDGRTGQNDIWTVRAADGSDPVRVTDTPDESEYAPTWQPIP